MLIKRTLILSYTIIIVLLSQWHNRTKSNTILKQEKNRKESNIDRSIDWSKGCDSMILINICIFEEVLDGLLLDLYACNVS